MPIKSTLAKTDLLNRSIKQTKYWVKKVELEWNWELKLAVGIGLPCWQSTSIIQPFLTTAQINLAIFLTVKLKLLLKVEVYLRVHLLTEKEQTLIVEKKLSMTGLSLSSIQSVETTPWAIS